MTLIKRKLKSQRINGVFSDINQTHNMTWHIMHYT